MHVRVAQEGPVTEHAIGAIALLVGGAIRRGVSAIGFETILDPLEHVAVHVVQTEFVRGERRHGRRAVDPLIAPLGLAAETRPWPPEVAVVVIELRSPRIRGGGTRPRGVLPFRLRRQPVRIVLPGLPVQPADEILRVEPAGANDRACATSPIDERLVGCAIRTCLERGLDADAVAPAIADTGLPLIPGDLGLRHGERRTIIP